MEFFDEASAHAHIFEALGLNNRDANTLSPLALAYVGDTVYDLYVRTYLLHSTDATVHGLHVKATKLVCAAAQAAAFHTVEPMLLPDELAVYKRGRNAHSATTPKNASILDYRTATGFEALVGYLYLTGRDDRLSSIMKSALYIA